MSSIGTMVNRTVMGVLGVVIFLAVGIALGPTILTSLSYVNSTTLSGVPLESVITLLADYFPAFYYLALVIGGITAIWAIVKFR